MITRTTTLLRAGAMAIAIAASQGSAQTAPIAESRPAQTGQAASDQTTAPDSGHNAPQGADQSGEATVGLTPAANHDSVVGRVLARWARSIGGRICVGPRMHTGDRVSRPNPGDQSQGWHISVPSFATAIRVSAPPAQAHKLQPKDLTPEGDGPANEPVQTASEPTGTN